MNAKYAELTTSGSNKTVYGIVDIGSHWSNKHTCLEGYILCFKSLGWELYYSKSDKYFMLIHPKEEIALFPTIISDLILPLQGMYYEKDQIHVEDSVHALVEHYLKIRRML